MTSVLTVSRRGTLSLPSTVRKRFGLRGGSRVFVEEKPEGLLLKIGSRYPVELYTKKRLAEFAREERALRRYKL